MRWRIEHDYRSLEEEVGLDRYEGRNRPDFHHHAGLFIAAYGFLVLHWPSGVKKSRSTTNTCRTKAFCPCGARTDAGPRALVNRHLALRTGSRHRLQSAHLPVPL